MYTSLPTSSDSPFRSHVARARNLRQPSASPPNPPPHLIFTHTSPHSPSPQPPRSPQPPHHPPSPQPAPPGAPSLSEAVHQLAQAQPPYSRPTQAPFTPHPIDPHPHLTPSPSPEPLPHSNPPTTEGAPSLSEAVHQLAQALELPCLRRLRLIEERLTHQADDQPVALVGAHAMLELIEDLVLVLDVAALRLYGLEGGGWLRDLIELDGDA